MRQTATFQMSTAGWVRPSAGARGAGMAIGGGERIGSVAVCWERLRSGAIAGS